MRGGRRETPISAAPVRSWGRFISPRLSSFLLVDRRTDNVARREFGLRRRIGSGGSRSRGRIGQSGSVGGNAVNLDSHIFSGGCAALLIGRGGILLKPANLYEFYAAASAHARASPIEGSDKRRVFAVLHLGGIRSPADAVRAAIVAEQRAK